MIGRMQYDARSRSVEEEADEGHGVEELMKLVAMRDGYAGE